MQTISTTHSRAKAGGEFGANGEWYEGGKFINTVPENAKRQGKSRKPAGKQEYENYKWALAPQEGMRAIFPMLSGIEMPNRSGGYIFNTNLRGDYATPEAIERRQSLIAKFNGGQRWI
jgi:hypothetical protein